MNQSNHQTNNRLSKFRSALVSSSVIGLILYSISAIGFGLYFNFAAKFHCIQTEGLWLGTLICETEKSYFYYLVKGIFWPLNI